MTTDAKETPGKLLSWLRLMRAPNVFTAMADVAMGFLFVSGSLSPFPIFLCLLMASSMLYIAGMVLNDVFDYEADLAERPQRPLPSGAISLAAARRAGFLLLAGGVLLAWIAGILTMQPRPLLAAGEEINPVRVIVVGEEEFPLPWRSGIVAFFLAAMVVLYDGVLKKTPLAPIAMGACRFFNVLLGMSLGAAETSWLLGYTTPQLLVAGGIGTYIAGVTWFARTEAKESSRDLLIWGVTVMLLGILMLAAFPEYLPFGRNLMFSNELVWPLLLLLLCASIFRRCLSAIGNPTPLKVQAAVKQCIFSLIVLDAAVVLAICDPWWALGVLALLAPTLLAGRWIYAT